MSYINISFLAFMLLLLFPRLGGKIGVGWLGLGS